MTINFNSLELILEAVRDRYKHYPNQFLTEEDIRSFTIAEMLKEEEFSRLQQTRDGSWSIPLHSEIRWYGVDRNLRFRSDIVLIFPRKSGHFEELVLG